MKKISNKIIKSVSIFYFLFSIFILPFSFSATFAYADSYVVLAPLPGIGNNTAKTTDLSTYLKEIFNLSIGIAAVMAFVMITFGGITYMTTDAISGKTKGREYITNALWGLLLVIGAWVILYTINPQLIDFSLIVPTPKTTSTGDTVTSP